MPVQTSKEHKIFPFLLYDGNANEAATYYTSVFKNSRIINNNPMAVTFELENERFVALNGPKSEFTMSVSFYIDCADQEEVDYFWDRFINDGGKASMCGWLSDKFGMFWQVIPKQLIQLMNDRDREKANRVMQAMMKMKKIVVADLEKAAKG
jgi:predicted 3-demethylubiquinone-9 3-methyltransferase (glyoxalase superfamily)